jgi:hypothetical protein
LTISDERRSRLIKNRFRRWLLEGIQQSGKPNPLHQAAWWKVMCLTGLDYFSTLGYQPGIAFLAAGVLSPLATLIVVSVTLFGLVPLYNRVCKESFSGQGSIAMLEQLLPGWRGKTLILILLGFAATDFVITITLSAADAAAHIVENPAVPLWMQSRIGLTLILLTILSAVFLKGFREAIRLSVWIVGVYLICNLVVAVRATSELFAHGELLLGWKDNIFQSYHSILPMIGTSLILFPKLALGMSGFETGVAVMPLVKGYASDQPEQPIGRIANTRKLLLTAAIIMSLFLMSSSIFTTVLIPAPLFQEHGAANGRALAYLAHKFFGDAFGTVYDISTIVILWFAGASAMAGLLNLVPRYLPRFGMAPNWARAQRPLVIFFTVISFTVTILFKANVDAQAGAYATGVLVLFCSAALAVTLLSWSEGSTKRISYMIILVVFVYTAVTNMVERPEGLQIASFFIGAILITSLISRTLRSLELRVQNVLFDSVSEQFIVDLLSTTGQICLLAHRPDSADYADKEAETRKTHKLTEAEASFVFLEVSLDNPSDFAENSLYVEGHEINGYKILRCRSAAIPNAIAAILLYLRDKTETIPHAYFGWTEGNPLGYIFKYIFLGEGETAPITREILREVEKDPLRRPRIIVG